MKKAQVPALSDAGFYKRSFQLFRTSYGKYAMPYLGCPKREETALP